ncbi:hypothetical protein [Pedobacter paludis]|uniref:Glycosyltransferase n=1 Tax=Pedobacter paludis TaxID=2203212 RepID=A0A317F2J3_9SPHI|nr:hypothetical protein [Pedobacter paludis]PWS31696.1 hypothetical protein DF947_14010 [Pedobacter paludis]
MSKLYVYYEELETDRWFKYDRFPRSLIRRFIRGPKQISGVERWFVNFLSGLKEIGQDYEVNNFKILKKNKDIIALVFGRPHLLEKLPDHTRIIYGPGLPSHPSENSFWNNQNLIHLIAPCRWMKEMFEQDLSTNIPISVWPSGIETDKWKPSNYKLNKTRVLVYDKIRWDRDELVANLLEPILDTLAERSIEVDYIKYGSYKEIDYLKKLDQVSTMIFLCEHETQGFAYLQALSKNIPIFAWDRQGYWQDPKFFPKTVQFKEVTSVPYWSNLCGDKFKNITEFNLKINDFLTNIEEKKFQPRTYILNNLTLSKQADDYLNIVNKIIDSKS